MSQSAHRHWPWMRSSRRLSPRLQPQLSLDPRTRCFFSATGIMLSHRGNKRSGPGTGGFSVDGYHVGVQETGGNTSFPGYGAIGRMANIASRTTIARAIAILRATRWLTLCRRCARSVDDFVATSCLAR